MFQRARIPGAHNLDAGWANVGRGPVVLAALPRRERSEPLARAS
jgi:hypothetical protein